MNHNHRARTKKVQDVDPGWGVGIETCLELNVGSLFVTILLLVGMRQIGIWLGSKRSASRQPNNSDCSYLLLNISHARPLPSSLPSLLLDAVTPQRVELSLVEVDEGSEWPLRAPMVHEQVTVPRNFVLMEPAASDVGLLNVLSRVGLDESDVSGLQGFSLGLGELRVSLCFQC